MSCCYWFESSVDFLWDNLTRAGIRPGDVVGITLPNGLAFLVAFFAVVSIRATAAPLNAAYKIDDFLFYMEDTAMKVRHFSASFSNPLFRPTLCPKTRQTARM